MPRPNRTDGKRKGTRRSDTPKKEAAVAAGLTEQLPGSTALVLSESVLYEMAKGMASYDTLGAIFGVSGAHVQQTYKELVERARAEGRKNLHAAQFLAATADRNPTMLIWLGKQYLGQKDVVRTEHTGLDGEPIKTQNDNTNRAVAYIPENNRDNKPDTDPDVTT
jgi:hypothetical protein